ncbi:alkaline phosphatase PhoX [Agromyces tardus]|nr:alkaline phosphatase PhoX [Agromyces tardus]
MRRRTFVALVVSAAAVGVITVVGAAGVRAFMGREDPTAATTAPPRAVSAPGFEPLAASAYEQESQDWDVPYLLPDGYIQTLVSDETTLDVYPGAPDLHDMNALNESGVDAGRYLYNTYEVATHSVLGATDLRTGASKVIADGADWGFDWRHLDGIRWTPWGTLLFDEETPGGHVYEAVLADGDPSTIVDVRERPQVGALRHEGIDVGADGAVYVVDERDGGSIFRFVPDVPGDLSAGTLSALRLTALDDAAQAWDPDAIDRKVGAFEWVALDRAAVASDADAAANSVAATEFGRPEDVEIIGETLYVANTSEDRVIAIDLAERTVSGFVEAGVNVPVEEEGVVTGLRFPDNLAEGPDGALWIVEDNAFSDIYRAAPDRDGDGRADRVDLFGSLVDQGAESTGITFGTDPMVVYVSVQHPDKPLADGIWAITPRR